MGLDNDGVIGIPADAVGGKSIDTTEVVRNSDQKTVERQRVNVSDPYVTTNDGIANVRGNELWVQDQDSRELLQSILCALQEILEELRS